MELRMEGRHGRPTWKGLPEASDPQGRINLTLCQSMHIFAVCS